MRRVREDGVRALEHPVDCPTGINIDRFTPRLARAEPFVHATPAQAAPIIAAVVAKRAFIAPPNPLEVRRARLERAITFLNTHAWFVQIVNREAAVRTYRVAGKRDAMLAEDVIRVAIEKGMEP